MCIYIYACITYIIPNYIISHAYFTFSHLFDFSICLHQKLGRTKRHRTSQNKGLQQPTVARSDAQGPKHVDEAHLQVAFFFRHVVSNAWSVSPFSSWLSSLHHLRMKSSKKF